MVIYSSYIRSRPLLLVITGPTIEPLLGPESTSGENAVQHPDQVCKVVLVSAPKRWDMGARSGDRPQHFGAPANPCGVEGYAQSTLNSWAACSATAKGLTPNCSSLSGWRLCSPVSFPAPAALPSCGFTSKWLPSRRSQRVSARLAPAVLCLSNQRVSRALIVGEDTLA